MLTIAKGESKYWVMTLTEKSTITNPYYLFEAFNKQTNVSTFTVLDTDLSDHPERYNKFSITETETPLGTRGRITLSVGEYIYKVYEQDNNTNTNPSGLNCVEENFLTCTTTADVNTEYESDTTSTVYEN